MEYLQIIRVQHLWFSADFLGPISAFFFFLGRCRLKIRRPSMTFLSIRSLHSLSNWHVGRVIDRNRCGLCHLVVRQLLVVFCPLASSCTSQGQNIWNGHFGMVLLSRVLPLCKSSAARCADSTFLAAVFIASLRVGIPTRRFPLCV